MLRLRIEAKNILFLVLICYDFHLNIMTDATIGRYINTLYILYKYTYIIIYIYILKINVLITLHSLYLSLSLVSFSLFFWFTKNNNYNTLFESLICATTTTIHETTTTTTTRWSLSDIRTLYLSRCFIWYNTRIINNSTSKTTTTRTSTS